MGTTRDNFNASTVNNDNGGNGPEVGSAHDGGATTNH